MLDTRVGLGAIVPVLLEMRLVLHPAKTQVVLCGMASEFEVRRVLHEVPGARSFAVSRRGTYLGVVVGPEAQAPEWHKAYSKFRARAAYVRSLLGHFGDRLRAYQVVAVSDTSSVARCIPLRADFLTVGSATLASLVAAPMHAVTPNALTAVSCFARRRFTPIGVRAKATLLRMGISMPELDDLHAAIGRAAGADEALLQPRRPAGSRHLCSFTCIVRAFALRPCWPRSERRRAPSLRSFAIYIMLMAMPLDVSFRAGVCARYFANPRFRSRSSWLPCGFAGPSPTSCSMLPWRF